MKMTFALLAVLLVLSGVAQAAPNVTVVSPSPVISGESNDLVVYKTVEEMRVPHVPEGLSASDAYDLVTGAKKEVIMKGKFIGGNDFSFASLFEIAMSPSVHEDTAFMYADGAWVSRPTRVEEEYEWVWFFDLILLCWPALLIPLVALYAKRQRVLLWQAALFFGILGMVAGQPWFAVALLPPIFMFFGTSFGDNNSLLKDFLFFLTGLISSLWVILLGLLSLQAVRPSDQFMTHYSVILLFIETLSYMLRLGADRWIRRRRPSLATVW